MQPKLVVELQQSKRRRPSLALLFGRAIFNESNNTLNLFTKEHLLWITTTSYQPLNRL